MSEGVIYVATGQKYIDEACCSASSVKEKMPFLKITIFSDRFVSHDCFDDVFLIEDPQYSFIDKIKYMYLSPYQKTLFIDTDTYICSDFSEIFFLLERFDIAAAHEPSRISFPVKEIPESFPEMNTGVVLFKKSFQVRKFFSDWLDFYQRDLLQPIKPPHDQPAFREALYRNKLQIATLSPEYNCRCLRTVYIGGEVKILHAHESPARFSLSKLSKYINQEIRNRVFIPGLGIVCVDQSKWWMLNFFFRDQKIMLPMFSRIKKLILYRWAQIIKVRRLKPRIFNCKLANINVVRKSSLKG